MAIKIQNLEIELENSKTNSLKEISDREKDLTNKVSLLEKDLELEKMKTSNSGLGKLYDEINNLKSLLEVERNRNKARKELGLKVGDPRDAGHKKAVSRGGKTTLRNLFAQNSSENRSFSRNADGSMKSETSKRERKKK